MPSTRLGTVHAAREVKYDNVSPPSQFLLHRAVKCPNTLQLLAHNSSIWASNIDKKNILKLFFESKFCFFLS